MTLTELSYYTRRSAPLVVIFFLILLIVYYIFKLLFIYLDLNKPKAIYTNTIFGKITPPKVENPLKKTDFDYFFDTVEGVPISASETARVYYLPPSNTRFGYREKIYLMAKNLGFDTTAVKHNLIGKEAVFSDGKQQLTIDITNFNFSYQYQFTGDEEFFLNTLVPPRETVENKAVDYLKSIGRYPNELAQGKTNLIYLYFDRETKNLSLEQNPNKANMIEIDFYRPDVDIFPVVSPTYFNSQNFLIIIFFGEESKILKAQIKFFEKSEEQYGVYPLKTGEKAWEELKAGQGIIVSAPVDKNQVTIKKMFFAYFDPDIYQDYFQPVYVFLGEENFVGYVPAVSNEYLIK